MGVFVLPLHWETCGSIKHRKRTSDMWSRPVPLQAAVLHPTMSGIAKDRTLGVLGEHILDALGRVRHRSGNDDA